MCCNAGKGCTGASESATQSPNKKKTDKTQNKNKCQGGTLAVHHAFSSTATPPMLVTAMYATMNSGRFRMPMPTLGSAHTGRAPTSATTQQTMSMQKADDAQCTRQLPVHEQEAEVWSGVGMGRPHHPKRHAPVPLGDPECVLQALCEGVCTGQDISVGQPFALVHDEFLVGGGLRAALGVQVQQGQGQGGLEAAHKQHGEVDTRGSDDVPLSASGKDNPWGPIAKVQEWATGRRLTSQ